jgi:hypothetical protein
MAKLQSGTTVYGNANVTTYLTVGSYVSAVGNVYAGNIVSTGSESVTGNITGGNILTAGQISATGNITANASSFFIGNGSLLTGVQTSNGGNLIVLQRTGTLKVPISYGYLLVVGRSGNVQCPIVA